MTTEPALRLAEDIVGAWLQLPGSVTAELMGSVASGSSASTSSTA